MRKQVWYQSNDLDEELADAQRRWAGDPPPQPSLQHCPECGSDEIYGNGLDARELACPRCGLQFDPRNYCCELCGGPLSAQDLADGETVCLGCAGGELVADISLDSTLLATVRQRLAGG